MANCNYCILTSNCPGFNGCPHNENSLKDLRKYLIKRKEELEPFILGSRMCDYKWQMIKEILEKMDRK